MYCTPAFLQEITTDRDGALILPVEIHGPQQKGVADENDGQPGLC